MNCSILNNSIRCHTGVESMLLVAVHNLVDKYTNNFIAIEKQSQRQGSPCISARCKDSSCSLQAKDLFFEGALFLPPANDNIPQHGTRRHFCLWCGHCYSSNYHLGRPLDGRSMVCARAGAISAISWASPYRIAFRRFCSDMM